MKHTIECHLHTNYSALEDVERYVQLWAIKNDTANANKTILVIQHSGILRADMEGRPNYRLHGGELKVFPNQTAAQWMGRADKVARMSTDYQKVRLDREGCIEGILHDQFGAVRAKPMIAAANLNLHYMQREDGSALLEGEEQRADEILVQVRSVEAEDKPMGWGAW